MNTPKTIGIIIAIIIVVILIIVVIFNQKREKTQKQEVGAPSEISIEGLKIEILKEGSGPEVQNGDKISVHYTGTLENGMKFDSSVDRGTPFSFTLGIGQVIQGWDMGVLGMKVGEKRKLTISPELAYGDNGIPGAIPPKSTLIFEVELLSVEK